MGSFAGEAATRTVDADGLLVTPGWVDIHTHYDGQATWDEVLAPTSSHGVTTIVTGNCGVGFAPARPDRHEWLIGLMEGVEDIPGTALSEGINWEWESFPEYLAALDRKNWALDVAALRSSLVERLEVAWAKSPASTSSSIRSLASASNRK